MARQSSQDRATGSVDESPDGESTGRSANVDAFWDRVRVDPVEIALPSGVGYTLRAYRLSTELAAPEIDREDEFPEWPTGRARDPIDDDEVEAAIDEEELTAQALAAGSRRRPGSVDDLDDDADDDEPAARRSLDDEDDDELSVAADDTADVDDGDASDDEDETDDEDDEVAAKDDAEPEEVPVFLAHRGQLLLFRSPEGLVDYVQSDAPHELTQLDTWKAVRDRLTPDIVEATYDDRYSLDLIVSNLRGGPDAWDSGLILQTGEVARDLAYALRLESVIALLSPGSPLDDLDETLRSIEQGGISGMFARRRARKRDSDSAAIGWRTVVGKISAAVDWRD